MLLYSIQGKIEVKILTRKNAEEAGDQWLTEEDTKSFRELLISLLVTQSCCFEGFPSGVKVVAECLKGLSESDLKSVCSHQHHCFILPK